MRREEFAGIVGQILEGTATAYLRAIYVPFDRSSLLMDTPSDGTFIVPYDANIRLAINKKTVPEINPPVGWNFILIQRVFRTVPQTVMQFGFDIVSLKAESQGKNALDVSDPDTANKLWKLLNGDSEISFTEFTFSKGDTSFSVRNDATARISRPEHDSVELILSLMEMASGERDICSAALLSLGEKRNDAEVMLQSPIILRGNFSDFLPTLKSRKQFHVTTNSQTACSVSFKRGVFQLRSIPGGVAVVPDPAFSLADVMSFLDGFSGVATIE